jgi:ribosome-associated protein
MTPSGDQPLTLPHGLLLPTSAWRWVFSRAGGPGGQNVNKVSTKATLVVSLEALDAVLPIDAAQRLRILASASISEQSLQISRSDSRSQLRNREACIEHLQELICRAMVRPRKRRATKPSKASVQRRLDQKKRRAQVKRQRRDTDRD